VLEKTLEGETKFGGRSKSIITRREAFASYLEARVDHHLSRRRSDNIFESAKTQRSETI